MLYVDILIRMENTKTPLKKSRGDKLFFCTSISVMKGFIYMGIQRRLLEIIFISMI